MTDPRNFQTATEQAIEAERAVERWLISAEAEWDLASLFAAEEGRADTSSDVARARRFLRAISKRRALRERALNSHTSAASARFLDKLDRVKP